MFDTLTERFEGVFDRLRGKGRLGEADVDAALREVRLALLEADVNVTVVRDLLARIKERALGADVAEEPQPGPAGHQDRPRRADRHARLVPGSAQQGPSPLTILMVGLQGSGKTTSAGKLAPSTSRSRVGDRSSSPPTCSAPPPSTNSRRSAPHRRARVHRSHVTAAPLVKAA
jgi:signal recognition particle GTPase